MTEHHDKMPFVSTILGVEIYTDAFSPPPRFMGGGSILIESHFV